MKEIQQEEIVEEEKDAIMIIQGDVGVSLVIRKNLLTLRQD